MRGFATVGVPSTMLEGARRHSLMDPDLLKAWFAGAVKRRDDQELAELAKRHVLDAAIEHIEEHLTDDPRPPVDYVEVPSGQIAKGVRAVAEATLKAAASNLSVDLPTVKWFRPATEGEDPTFSWSPLNGLADREAGIVWLSAALTAFQVAVTAAHEMSHMAGQGELDARLYGAQYEMRK